MYLATAQEPIYHMTYFQAVIIGIIQGFFELFPLSSLGHTVLIPSWIGGNWATLVRQESQSESPYLAFIVGLHLANAVALLAFYLKEWGRIISSFFRTLVRRHIDTDTERLAWLIVIATVPVGIIGLVFEHEFRVLFAKPVAAAVFLMCNGLILLRRRVVPPAHSRSGGRRGHRCAGPSPRKGVRRRAPQAPHRQAPIDRHAHRTGTSSGPGTRTQGASPPAFATTAWSPSMRTQNTSWRASGSSTRSGSGRPNHWRLLAGISREGVVMVGGLFRGLTTRTPCASLSCFPPPSSSPPAPSRCRTWSARSATASAGRSSPAASPPS